MMTRKAVIRLIAGLAGVVGVATSQNAVATLMQRRRTPPDPKALKRCLDEQAAATKQGVVAWMCVETQGEEIPGTSRIRLNLDELEAVEVTLSGQTRRITRQELWESL